MFLPLSFSLRSTNSLSQKSDYLKEIKNKTIPNPLRPKFRQKAQSNIYFLSQRKVSGEKKLRLIKNIRLISILSICIYICAELK